MVTDCRQKWRKWKRYSSISAGFEMITYKPRERSQMEDTLAHLRGLADDMSYFEMRQIVERDATLKMILLLPEPVLDQALAVGRALQACAKHRRSSPEDLEASYRKP